MGFFLFESAGEWAIQHLGWQSGYRRFQELFAAHGFWAILALGVVPVPFQTAMLAAGTAEYPLPLSSSRRRSPAAFATLDSPCWSSCSGSGR